MEVAGKPDQQDQNKEFQFVMIFRLQQCQAGEDKKKLVTDPVKTQDFPQHIDINDRHHQAEQQEDIKAAEGKGGDKFCLLRRICG